MTESAIQSLANFTARRFDQLMRYEDGRTPLYLTEEQYNAIRDLVAQAGATPAKDAILVQAVAVTRNDDDDGLRLDWVLEGGISELEFAGTVLFAMPEANNLCDEDGSAYLYRHADPAEVDRLRAEADDLDATVHRQGGLLSETAIALRGPEPSLTRYDHADIPLRVKTVVQQLDEAVTALNEICAVSKMGERPFEIATLAIGEMSSTTQPAECLTCSGHGLVGSNPDHGEPCPDCNKPAVEQESSQELDMDAERETFEVWADEKGFCLDCEFFAEGNNYENDDTRLAFDIWLARAAQPADGVKSDE